MTHRDPKLTRRTLLRGTCAAGATVATSPLALAIAQADPSHRVVICFFDGGWDLLLGPDARDPGRAYEGIDLGTNLLASQYRTPISVSIGAQSGLWGTPMQPLVEHTDVCTLFNGVNMNTVSHEAGTVYALTGVQPAGATPLGPSVGAVAAIQPGEHLIPHISIDLPSYGLGIDPAYQAVGIANIRDIETMLSPNQTPIAPDVLALLKGAQDTAVSCLPESSGGSRPLDDVLLSRARLEEIFDNPEKYAAMFDYDRDDLARVAFVRSHYFGGGRGGANAVEKAAATSQLLHTGLSRSVMVNLVGGLDTHANEWAQQQPERLSEGFTAMGQLLSDLRTDDPGLNNTTVIAYSEFGRTPTINGDSGRDHHFANSFLVFSGRLKPGIAGATVTDTLNPQPIDLITGAPSSSGEQLTPEHVAATIVEATVGLNNVGFNPYRTQPLQAWIK